jgi:DNA-binding response OmpR family regulator
LIVLDVMLGSMDGFTVCEIIRRQLSTKNIPVIMVTAATGQIARLNGLRAGADEFMSKPFSPRELLARVESTLRRHEEKMHALNVEAEQTALPRRPSPTAPALLPRSNAASLGL